MWPSNSEQLKPDLETVHNVYATMHTGHQMCLSLVVTGNDPPHLCLIEHKLGVEKYSDYYTVITV